MSKKISYIYIMTNPSFPDYVKIGATHKRIEDRLKSLNKSECIPFSFRIWAYFKVESSLKDINLHKLIDGLNPNLRSKEEINGRLRKREFYLMKPEEAFSLIKQIALMTGKTKDLIKCKPSPTEAKEEKTAKRNALKARSSNLKFSDFGIKPGETLTFKNTNVKCTVKNDRQVTYEGKAYSISTLASKLIKEIEHKDSKPNGFRCFKYRGKTIKK